MPIVIVSVVGNIFCQLLGNKRLESSPTYCYKVWDVNRKQLVVPVCTVNSWIACQWLHKKKRKRTIISWNLLKIAMNVFFAYDMPVVFQRAKYLALVVMCGNTYSYHQDSKYVANNRDQSYT